MFSFFLIPNVYSQDLDLIVSTKGDSIACQIDSINDTHIFYEMKFNGNWINTTMTRSDVQEYKQNAIVRKDYMFKHGTTIIESPWDEATPVYQIRKNSVYLGLGP